MRRGLVRHAEHRRLDHPRLLAIDPVGEFEIAPRAARAAHPVDADADAAAAERERRRAVVHLMRRFRRRRRVAVVVDGDDAGVHRRRDRAVHHLVFHVVFVDDDVVEVPPAAADVAQRSPRGAAAVRDDAFESRRRRRVVRILVRVVVAEVDHRVVQIQTDADGRDRGRRRRRPGRGEILRFLRVDQRVLPAAVEEGVDGSIEIPLVLLRADGARTEGERGGGLSRGGKAASEARRLPSTPRRSRGATPRREEGSGGTRPNVVRV
eukprot:31231-Pelagococcus_subviridis.AAC.10